MQHKTSDQRISDRQEVLTANTLIEEQPISEAAAELVVNSRQNISRILLQEDKRLIVVVGPCSIHDPSAAKDYAGKLLEQAELYKDQLQVVMRVYFEKPRTTVGWKGLINDPDLDNSFKINKGLATSRQLLRDLTSMGVCAGTEFLDVITPQYIGDLISWGAIGARTTESQVHRELASGLSCPVGFKNSTNGSVQVAADAIGSARNPHRFLSVTKEGRVAAFTSTGNKDCHVILRGGNKPNYRSEDIEEVSQVLKSSNLLETIMVDMSHGNSSKQHKKQLEVCADIANQLAAGENRITGVMIESNIEEGNQSANNKADLIYGKSITDACINWEDTLVCLNQLSEAVQKRT